MVAMASSSLLNGERVVVAFFILRIIYSTSFSLLYESLSLFLLSLFSLSVEIAVESLRCHSSLLNTRPGASSGILLGAVSLPGVLFSRLIQLSRAVLVNEIGVEELEYLRLQYWATTASCFSVLVFLCFILRYQSNSTNSFSLHSYWETKLNISFITLYAAVLCVSFTAKSFNGWYTTLMLLWVLSHGLAAVRLLQHVLHTFPACASIGEALLVTAGLVLYFGDMFACTAVKIYGYLKASELNFVHSEIKRNEISTIIQGMLLGLILFPLFFKHVLRIWEHFTNLSYFEVRLDHDRGRSALFYASLAFILIVIVPSWIQLVQDFPAHPLLWVFDFVLSEPFKRLSLCIYWVAVIFASVIRFYNISKSSKIERILLRKYYHLMAVIMFVPALILQPKFLDLAFGLALAVFLMLEIIRAVMENLASGTPCASIYECFY